MRSEKKDDNTSNFSFLVSHFLTDGTYCTTSARCSAGDSSRSRPCPADDIDARAPSSPPARDKSRSRSLWQCATDGKNTRAAVVARVQFVAERDRLLGRVAAIAPRAFPREVSHDRHGRQKHQRAQLTAHRKSSPRGCSRYESVTGKFSAAWKTPICGRQQFSEGKGCVENGKILRRLIVHHEVNFQRKYSGFNAKLQAKPAVLTGSATSPENPAVPRSGRSHDKKRGNRVNSRCPDPRSTSPFPTPRPPPRPNRANLSSGRSSKNRE